MTAARAIVVASGLSLALHAAGLATFQTDSAPDTPGGQARVAMIGNSFADAAAGVVSGAVVPDPADVASPRDTTARVAPVRPAAPAPSVSAPQGAAAAAAPQKVTPTAMPADPPAAAPPDTRARAAPRTPAPAAAPPDRIAALEPPEAQAPDDTTPRPTARRDRPPPPKGNAQQAARRGDAAGQAEGRAASSATTATTARDTGQGRAAAAYPGVVNARIAATRREHTNRRGTVVLAFAVGPGGGLAALDIARSSGDSALDRIALDHVRRAAPFPPPPEGAQTRFSIAFEGRR